MHYSGWLHLNVCHLYCCLRLLDKLEKPFVAYLTSQFSSNSRFCNLLRRDQEKQFEWFLSIQRVYRYLHLVVKAKQAEMEVHIIPGNHITTRTEHLPVLAERLRECLSKVQATVGS